MTLIWKEGSRRAVNTWRRLNIRLKRFKAWRRKPKRNMSGQWGIFKRLMINRNRLRISKLKGSRACWNEGTRLQKPSRLCDQWCGLSATSRESAERVGKDSKEVTQLKADMQIDKIKFAITTKILKRI